jgi:hypothetical protein
MSEIFDLATQRNLDEKSDAFQILVDIIIITSYFTEIIPSILINYVLWRSFKELKYRKDASSSKSHASHPHDISKNPNKTFFSISAGKLSSSPTNDVNSTYHVLSGFVESFDLAEGTEGYKEFHENQDDTADYSPPTYY